MSPAEFQSHLDAIEAGDAARSAIEDRACEILRIARDIRTARVTEWDRIAEFTRYGDTSTLFHYYRGAVDKVSLENHLTISLTISDYFRGETDYEHRSFPREWMTLSNDEVKAALTAQFDALLAKADEIERAKVAKAEAEQRAEFERLKAKFSSAAP